MFGILLAAYGVAHFLQATAIRSELQIATVERGQLQERVSARGTVLPAFEQIVSRALGSEIRELLSYVDANCEINVLARKCVSCKDQYYFKFNETDEKFECESR